jgi:3-oxoacyl-[acyl-carrier-protein] synthase-1
MISALGDVVRSCAAARARLSRSTELKVLSFGHEGLFGKEESEELATVYGHAAIGVADGFSGIGKVLALGKAGLSDLLSRVPPFGPRDLDRTGFFLSLSDYAVEDAASRLVAQGDQKKEAQSAPLPSAEFQRRCEGLFARLSNLLRLEAPFGNQATFFAGHAGFAKALDTAMASLARGQIDRAIVGGIDSRVDTKFLSAAAALGLLRTNENPVGLVGGEAAAFAMIERQADVARRQRQSLGALSPVALASDERSQLGELPPDGIALSSVVERASHGVSAFFLGDLNGVERRAFEWGNAVTRSGASGPLWVPAVSFGDTGAASGAVGLCMAARAFARGYAPASTAVVWLASESGLRGAFALQKGGGS